MAADPQLCKTIKFKVQIPIYEFHCTNQEKVCEGFNSISKENNDPYTRNRLLKEYCMQLQIKRAEIMPHTFSNFECTLKRVLAYLYSHRLSQICPESQKA